LARTVGLHEIIIIVGDVYMGRRHVGSCHVDGRPINMGEGAALFKLLVRAEASLIWIWKIILIIILLRHLGNCVYQIKSLHNSMAANIENN
jgi:hypothetical protein